MPRVPQIPIYRDNPPAESPCQYYKYSLTLPTLYNLLTQLDERFKESSKPYRDAMQINPDLMITAHYKNVEWRVPIFQFVGNFDNDIPHSGSIRSEFDIWFIFWTDHITGNRPDSISSTLKIIDEYAFPNIYAILKILAVIPITTCSCERSISTLRRLKDYKRSSHYGTTSTEWISFITYS